MRPLSGIGVAVTRAEIHDGPLTQRLEAEGAHVLNWPCVGFARPLDEGPLIEAIGRLGDYDWIVVSSRRTVEALARHSAACPPGTRVAAVGPSTAEALESAGWRVDRLPEEHGSFGAAGLVAAFGDAGDAAGALVLFPCSDRARPELPRGLREMGATVERVIAYRAVDASLDPQPVRRSVEEKEVQVATFTSPSAVQGFARSLGVEDTSRILQSLRTAVIGETTAGALQHVSAPASILAHPSTMKGLVEAVVSLMESDDAGY